MPKLSVTVITRNEAANVAAALQSVAWADEIVVVDSGSTDETVAIARRYTNCVSVRAWHGYSDQRNHAASIATHDWVLSLDADERVSPALAEEIRGVLKNEPPVRGYRIPRVTWHLGRWIRSTDWYPDPQLRLYDRRGARCQHRLVHESVTIDGPPGLLHNHLEHYAYRDLCDHLQKIDLYTTLAARQMHADGKRTGPLQMAVHPPAAFIRNYLLRRGITDGVPGLVISVMNSYYVFLKLAKLWELQGTQSVVSVAAGEAPGATSDSRGSHPEAPSPKPQAP